MEELAYVIFDDKTEKYWAGKRIGWVSELKFAHFFDTLDNCGINIDLLPGPSVRYAIRKVKLSVQ